MRKYLGSQGPDIWDEKLFRLLLLDIFEFKVREPVQPVTRHQYFQLLNSSFLLQFFVVYTKGHR